MNRRAFLGALSAFLAFIGWKPRTAPAQTDITLEPGESITCSYTLSAPHTYSYSLDGGRTWTIAEPFDTGVMGEPLTFEVSGIHAEVGTIDAKLRVNPRG